MEHNVITTLTEKISAFPHVEKVILYGSRARGSHGNFSDIDIAVAGKHIEPGEWSSIRRLADVEDSTIRTLLKIDLVRMERAGETLRESIQREGKTLYVRH